MTTRLPTGRVSLSGCGSAEPAILTMRSAPSLPEPHAPRTVAAVLISPFEGRVIVAFPQKVWDKKSAKRILHGPFQKPILVEVAACNPDERSFPVDSTVKVWVGLLNSQLADRVVFDHADSPSVNFLRSDGRPGLPNAQALLDLAETHFSFITGASAAPVAASEADEDRLDKLEKSVAAMAQSIDRMLAAKPAAPAASPAPNTAKAKAKRSQAAKPAGEGSVPGTPVPRGAAKEAAWNWA